MLNRSELVSSTVLLTHLAETCLSSCKGATDNSIQIVKHYLEKTLVDTNPAKGEQSAQERRMKGDQIGCRQQSTRARLGDGTESDASHVNVETPNNRTLSLPGASSPAPTRNPTLAPSSDRAPLTKDLETHDTVLRMQPIQEKSCPEPCPRLQLLPDQVLYLLLPVTVVILIVRFSTR